MEQSNILKYFEGKTIFITGATGFLAKVFVEKILRAQPSVKKLFLLIRNSATKSVEQRLQDEVIETELFRVLRERCGEEFKSIISSKVIPISGDVTYENLGIIDPELREVMWQEIDIIINSAATTNFYERYDVAFRINAMGAMHVRDFAIKCSKLEMLLQVSTAKMHGWPNTYVFTKAIGEMMLQNYKEKTKIIILRPTAVTSTFSDPFPGWIEGVRTLDAVFVPYGKGELKCFIGDPETTLDMIPGDMVVNCMIAAIEISHWNDEKDLFIYQVGSSRRNPITLAETKGLMTRYLTNNPLLNTRGNPITVKKFKTFTTVPKFHNYMSIRYFSFLKMLKVINMLSLNHFESTYNNLRRRENTILRLAEHYKPYCLSKAIFDDANTENLRVKISRTNLNGVDVFNFDPKSITWDDYFLNTHFPGLVKYVLKQL